MPKVRYNKRNQSRRSTKESNWINRILDSGLGQIVLLIISALMILSVYRSVKQMSQKISLLRQAEQEVRELRLKNLELSLRIENAGSIESLEKEARDRLNYGKENEIVFVIDDDLIEVGKEKVQAILYPEEDIVEEDVFDEWVDFIVRGY
ncbi:MAG: transmembrane(s)protein [candidate division WS6 bacterium 34_10]|uniref:Transmembrane(S)protein n=1 Tax=candidate division WS6 bacterium 34_10 TaxID=1641389 RepID=A0A101HGX5_9BACT|nr:MAG: transmembrane(s)protein [candidate division WS6 bacterium 34_10]